MGSHTSPPTQTESGRNHVESCLTLSGAAERKWPWRVRQPSAKGTEFSEADIGGALTAHLEAFQLWSCAWCLGTEGEAEAERLPTVMQSLALVTVSLEQGAWPTHGLGLMVCVLGLTLLDGGLSQYPVTVPHQVVLLGGPGPPVLIPGEFLTSVGSDHKGAPHAASQSQELRPRPSSGLHKAPPLASPQLLEWAGG